MRAIEGMSRSEKLRLMEALWDALSSPEQAFESPAWHAEVLAETERQHAEGSARFLAWKEGKALLRSRSR